MITFIGIGIILFLLVFAVLISSLFIKRAAKTKKCDARVVGKTSTKEQQGMIVKQLMSRHQEYVISFEAEGRCIALLCSEEAFQALSVGDQGHLLYKGTQLIDFQQNK